eukprot:2629805-Prymnesium_polylepis.1
MIDHRAGRLQDDTRPIARHLVRRQRLLGRLELGARLPESLLRLEHGGLVATLVLGQHGGEV